MDPILLIKLKLIFPKEKERRKRKTHEKYYGLK
jgi:hypothetical protein